MVFYIYTSHVTMQIHNAVRSHHILPVSFSITTLLTTAPNLTPDPSGWDRGWTVMADMVLSFLLPFLFPCFQDCSQMICQVQSASTCRYSDSEVDLVNVGEIKGMDETQVGEIPLPPPPFIFPPSGGSEAPDSIENARAVTSAATGVSGGQIRQLIVIPEISLDTDSPSTEANYENPV